MNGDSYIIALLTHKDTIISLDVGRSYSRMAAMDRAEMLEKTVG